VEWSGTATTRGVKRLDALFISPFGVPEGCNGARVPSIHTTAFDASARSFPEDWRRTRPEIEPARSVEAGTRSVNRSAAESDLIP
jgi:hypothetical protein